MKLNKSYKDLSAEEKTSKLKSIKEEFYDGLMDDLMAVKGFELAQVIYGEKQRDKFNITKKDRLKALEIFAAQAKQPEYIEMFNELVSDDGNVDQFVCEELVRTLTYYENNETFKPQMLDMVEKV